MSRELVMRWLPAAYQERQTALADREHRSRERRSRCVVRDRAPLFTAGLWWLLLWIV